MKINFTILKLIKTILKLTSSLNDILVIKY